MTPGYVDRSREMTRRPPSADSDESAVNVLTIHKARVWNSRSSFLSASSKEVSLAQARTEDAFPETLIKEIHAGGDFHLQEERRLFYGRYDPRRNTSSILRLP